MVKWCNEGASQQNDQVGIGFTGVCHGFETISKTALFSFYDPVTDVKFLKEFFCQQLLHVHRLKQQAGFGKLPEARQRMLSGLESPG